MQHHALAVFLGIALVAGISTGRADMVILKSGEMYQTPRAWKENGVVNYYRNGRVVRVDDSEVDRLIHVPVPPGRKTPPGHRPADQSPPDTTAAGQPAPSPLPDRDDAGHLDLKWGQPLAQFEGVTLVATDPAYGGVQQYTQKTRNPRFGRASVDNVFYGFWQGRLYTVLVEVSNFLDFQDLQAEAVRRYGEGRKEDARMETYRWTDPGSDRLLSYDFDSDTGFLWMRSRAMHDKVRVRYPD